MGKGNISLKVFLLKMENKMQDTILSAEASTPPLQPSCHVFENILVIFAVRKTSTN